MTGAGVAETEIVALADTAGRTFDALFVDEFGAGVGVAGMAFDTVDVVTVVADEFELDEATVGAVAREEEIAGAGLDGALVVALFVDEFATGVEEAGVAFDAGAVVVGELGETAGVLCVDSVDEDVWVDTGVAVAVGPSAHAETGDSRFITITSVSVRIRQTTLLRFIKT